jgi:hypothetical protein
MSSWNVRRSGSGSDSFACVESPRGPTNFTPIEISSRQRKTSKNRASSAPNVHYAVSHERKAISGLQATKTIAIK